MPSRNKLWAYIAKLEKVIKTTMESSEEISELVEKIQREGIEVSLNCIALFSDPKGRTFAGSSGGPGAAAAAAAAEAAKSGAKGRPRKAKKTDKKPAAAGKGKGKAKPEFKVTDADREFLKQIGIRFD